MINKLQSLFPKHYRSGNILLINADCMDVMAAMGDKCVDLAIVDPPYFDAPQKLGYYGSVVSNTKVKRGNYQTISVWKIPDDNYFNPLFYISINQIIWGCNYYAKYIPNFGRIIWDKKNDSSSFSKAEIASCSLHDSVQMFRYEWNGMLQGDMKNKEVRQHPCQKPVKLYQWLLHNYAKPGQTIFDSHLGSASSAIAAHYFGCTFIGVELDEDYFSASVERFKLATAQIDLMDFA